MNKGLEPMAIPKEYKVPQPAVPEEGVATQLPGYGQVIVDAQIETDDDSLRDRIRTLQQREVLILRGDRDNSLVPRPGCDLNETLMK